MPSTVIRRYAYDHSTNELWVEFVTGRRDVYSDVPPQVAETLGSAFAKGVYCNSRTHDRYPCPKVASEDHETDS
ncbi:MAG: KTSC domain-containing protein [Sphingomicrobium sp.]